MKKIYGLLLAGAFLLPFTGMAKQAVIPQPAEYVAESGSFKVPQSWHVKSSLSKEASKRVLKALKSHYELIDSKKKEDITLYLKDNKELGDENYILEVTPQCVTIQASGEKGFYYGLQSLYQLSYLTSENGEIACCTITDSPRFQHRGLMLDVTRFFIPKDEVKKMIDVASALKLNNLHMHLTDDNGWRMEIKKYPKLTEVGAWRVDRPEIFPGRMNPTSADEPTPVGGFYTQDDLREIVDYAAERFVNVIPEIEMPAHAAAAIASYPELACPVVDKFVGVFPGIGGPDASIIMCAGNDNVYQFYKDVLDEVMDVFPSPYIHLGGDEANKRIWEICELCNEKIKDLNLKDYEALQGYFMDQLNSYVHSKGRMPMGWDEVTYGNPQEDMVILGWQGNGNVAVKDSRKSGRKFIMTPAKTLYLIRYQGPQWFEPFTYFGNNTLKDVYEYEAVQDDWTPELKENLLGIQGSLWTEFAKQPEDVEYLTFPRLIAVADAAWRPEGSGDWEGFIETLDEYLPELDSRDITYARSMYNIQHTASPQNGRVKVELKNERPDLEIKYALKGDENNIKTYRGPLYFKNDATVNAYTVKDGKQVGSPLTLNISHNKATGKKVTSPNCNNQLAGTITNGLRGSNRISDMEWAGWNNRDAEFIVDLGSVEEINNARLGTIGFSHIVVAMPQSVELLASEDGENYELISTYVTPEELIFAKEPTRNDIDFGDLNTKARYLKVVAKNPGKIPAGYAREGTPTWIYFDELMIN